MAVPIIGNVLNLISGGIESVFDFKTTKLQTELKKRGLDLKEAELQVMKEVTEIEFQKYVMDNALEIDGNFRDFVVQYEGAAKDVHPFVQTLRSIIRPIITIWAVGLISYLMFSTPEKIEEISKSMAMIPERLWDIFYIVFFFWFGGRAVQHLVDKYTKGKLSEAKEVATADVKVAVQQTKQEEIKLEQQYESELPRTHHTEEEKSTAFRRGHGKHRGIRRRK